MFKSIAVFAVLCIAAASAGLIHETHVVQPVVAKVGTVVHSAPSAVSHQSFTRVHNKAVVQDVVAPVVKTVAVAPVVKTVAPVVPVVKTVTTPVVHAAPVVHAVHAAPVVHTYHAAPAVVKTYHAAPVVHSVPVVHTAPVVKTVVPAAYTIHH